MAYSVEHLAQVKRQAERFAREDPAGGRLAGSPDGRLSMRVPTDAYFAAINANGGIGKDGKTVWNDTEWVRDMQRLHPEIVRHPDIVNPVGLRNRFGRVSFRKVYPTRSNL